MADMIGVVGILSGLISIIAKIAGTGKDESLAQEEAEKIVANYAQNLSPEQQKTYSRKLAQLILEGDEAQLSELQEQLRLELENKRTDFLTSIEMREQQVDMMIKIAKAEAELMQTYLIQADEFLKQQYPELTPEQRIEHVDVVAQSLMKGQETLSQLRIGWSDTPHPTNLSKQPVDEDNQ